MKVFLDKKLIGGWDIAHWVFLLYKPGNLSLNSKHLCRAECGVHTSNNLRAAGLETGVHWSGSLEKKH